MAARLSSNALLAPPSRRIIRDCFGHPAILDEHVDGYRIIQVFSRLRADAVNLDSYVFDAKRYRLVAHAIPEPCGLKQWERRMRDRP